MPPCGKGIYIRWQHLIFLFKYMVQPYKEDWTILQHMLGCQAIALPSTEQIVNFPCFGYQILRLLMTSSGIELPLSGHLFLQPFFIERLGSHSKWVLL